jgi:hypothetical protein
MQSDQGQQWRLVTSIGVNRKFGYEEVPRAEIVGFVAAQLGLPTSAWSEYAKPDQTRREQLQELQRH